MIIVTGGAGFIGSNLVARLGAQGDDSIVVCDVFGQDEKWKNLRSSAVTDIIAPEDLIPYLDRNAGKVKAIFHLGAISTTTETDADLMMENNFKFSLRLLEWCINHQTRIIYASSAATYGEGRQGFADEESSEELEKLLPMNVYAWSKHLFDRRVAAMKKAGLGLPPQCVGLKFFNVYGPNEYHKGSQRSVISQVFDTVKSGDMAKLFKSHHPDYSDGGQLRDFIWVEDCVDVMLWLLENPQVSGLFNVGTGKARSFFDLATSVYKALDQAPKIEYIDMPQGLREKYQYFTEAKMEKLRSAGYQGKFTSLEEGTRRYVQDYLAKDDPYR